MSLKSALNEAKKASIKERDSIKGKRKLSEASKRETRVARIISRYTNRLSRAFVTANDHEKTGILAALTILGQAQTLAQIDPNESRNLLASARRVANVRDDDE